MARKRNRRPKRTPYFWEAHRVWTARERFQLLAYLNWCVQYNQGNFDNTAADHLERATNKKFTQYQIQEQLKDEWDAYGRKGSKFEELFSVGTAALETLRPREQNAIEQMLARIGPPSEGHRLRSTARALASRSHTLPTVRPTRETTEKTTPSLQCRRGKQTVGELEVPQSGRWLRSTSRSLATRSQTLSASRSTRATTEPAQRPKAKQTRRQAKQKARTRYSARLASHGQSSEDEIARGHTPEVVKGEDATRLSVIPSTENPTIDNIAGSTIPDSEDESLPSPSVKAKLENAEAEISRLRDHVLTLLNRQSEADKQIQELKDMKEVISSSQASNEELQKKIARMKKKRLNQDSFFRHLGALQSDNLAFAGKSRRREFMLLYYDTYETSQNICQASSDGSVQAHIPEYAQSWVEFIYDGDFGSFVEYAETQNISKPKLLSALLMAAIFKVVMEPVFPSESIAQSPLLDQYRKLISDQCGQKTLKQLDLIAIRFLLSDEEVLDQFLSEAARWLSTIILPALNYFLPMVSQDQLSQDVLGNLERTLLRALSIKIEAMPSLRRFRRIFFRSGTQFDAESMRYEDSETTSVPTSQTVKLCLFPAIFYETGDEGDEDGASAIVNKYPGCFMEASIAELKSLTLVSKAIVLAW
ncbi:unnamed protein product [Fusarium equiseti]|uniref:Uncharacterized protein n=1 Tax=Fusarium equiseti TaxID=61235 RepID=A0A8J2III8_FUSEQ|nr:unnamed protein product [Fusarium equiseti]